MKKLRAIHLYLGCLFAPALIFFAVTGAWQLFALHRARKDGYTPPRTVLLLSHVHQFQHISATGPEADTPLRLFLLAAAIGLVVSTVLGIIMAFRYGRSKARVVLCLLAGMAVPVAILFLYP